MAIFSVVYGLQTYFVSIWDISGYIYIIIHYIYIIYMTLFMTFYDYCLIAILPYFYLEIGGFGI